MKLLIHFALPLLMFAQIANAQETQGAPEGMIDFASSRKYSLFSEGLPLPNSPEAYSMIQYSSPQANLYRGEVSVDIPFYTYSDSDFEIPISFSYRSGGHQPNVPYGVMGLGWSLNAGGFISREIRGIADESASPTNKDQYKFVNKLYGDNDRDVAFPEPDMYGYSYWFKADSTDNQGYYHQDCVLDFKVGAEFMPTMSPNIDSDDIFHRHIETTPDIFHFSVPGHSGSFVLAPHGKAIFFDTTGASEFYKLEANFNASSITSFTITSDDRYVFIFDVVEQSASYNTRFSEDYQFITNTWKLSSIVAPNGRRVEYSYGLDYWTDAMVPFEVDEVYARELRSVKDHIDGEPIDEASRYESFIMNNNFPTLNVVINKPLTKITIDNKVQYSFDYSEQHCRDGSSYTGKNLVCIGIIDLPTSDTTRFCRFSYHLDGRKDEECSLDNRGVTFLDGLTLSDFGTYLFEYNEPSSGMPKTDTYAIDWYGFYNGNNESVAIQEFLPDRYTAKTNDNYLLNTRKPSEEHCKVGMLTKLTYPTGGWTQFTYEQNTYSKDHLNTSCKLNLEPDGGHYYGAGVRLKSMSDYSDVGKEYRRTDYKYVNEDGKSSGCLLWRPIIYSNYSARTTNILDLDRETVSSANDFTYSGQPHIEYLRVLEEVYDPEAPQHRGITEYTYETSYQISARDNYDVGVGLNIHDWEYNCNSYENMRHSSWIQSNEQSRMGGRLSTRTTYSDDLTKPIQKDSITYSLYYPTTSSLTSYIVALGFPTKLFYSFASVIKNRSYEFTYDKNGDIISRVCSDLRYDTEGRFSGTHQVDSRGRNVKTELTYHNVVPALVTQSVTKVDDVIVKIERYNYIHLSASGYPDLYVPSSMKRAILESETTNNDSWEYKIVMTFDEYDSKGRLLQSTDERGVKTSYVWGYDGRYLIAAVEGVSYQELKNNPNLRNYSELFGTNGRYYPSGIPSVVESKLRNLPGVLVTTWEHDPLVGVTKYTDQSGRIYTHSYDSHNRLAESTMHGNTVLMQYLYNIISENQ